MPPPHSAENIRLKFDDILAEKGVHLFALVSDNGANIKNAFEIRVFEKGKQPSKTLQLFQDSGTESETDDESDSEIDSLEQQLDSEQIFTNSIRCVAHTLQLVVHDGLKAILLDARKRAALQKAKALAKLSSKSSNFAYQISGNVPPQSTVTRWNSEFRLLQFVVQHHTEINSSLNIMESSSKSKTKKVNLILSQPDIEVLTMITEHLGYFLEATDILEGEKVSTICKVIPVIISLESAKP